MQTLKQLYRDTYVGEHVVTSLSLNNQAWEPVTEHVPNSVFNTHSTTQAIIIGNGESRTDFNLTHIANHNAGLGGADRLQSYGCNALYRDFTPDFLVAVGAGIVDEIANTDYTTENIVYTNSHHLLKYPGKFYLIPQNIPYDAGSIAAYMACFDGHKKVFLLGFDGYDDQQAYKVNNIYKDTNNYPTSQEIQSSTFWLKTMTIVMNAYPDVEFVRVMPYPTWTTPAEFADRLNFRQISFREFILESDVG
jgi:hypothetical protein